MKRRTQRSGTIRKKQHHAAFVHAIRAFNLPPKRNRRLQNGKATHDRNGICIRIFLDLELESGGTIEVEFSCTRGFRFEGNLGHHWDMDPIKPESIRHLPFRLQAYRDKLHAWNTAANQPLTFSSFNLLLAALSYDIAANLSHPSVNNP